MAFWLFKQEPEAYCYADLERDGATTWDGVANALALQHLRKVRAGDRIWFYHTGKEKAVVGEMTALADPVEVAKAVTVQVGPVRRLARPVSLAVVKADELLKGWDLTRLPRLSVMPVTAEQWARVESLAAG